MNETITTIVGNVVDAPNKRTLESGVSVTSFRVASTARRFDRVTNQWTDGDSLFLKVTCWRTLSENTSACVVKGDPVIVTGRLFSRTYEVVDGKRASYELEATAIGFDLNRGRGDFKRVSAGRAVTVDDVGPDRMPTGSSIDAHIQSGGAPADTPDDAFDETNVDAGEAFENASPVRPAGDEATNGEDTGEPAGSSAARAAEADSGDGAGGGGAGAAGAPASEVGEARNNESASSRPVPTPRPPARRRGASPVPA
ncbi:single-stranded DNA-binding protein [Cryptosporangium japonicum]|uniref:Single-stranded DNA-binding protein n=1 Tax=Cryptosporangium japonicum TaxID=80872 RepID=A0ABP3E7S8_9ACTN